MLWLAGALAVSLLLGLVLDVTGIWHDPRQELEEAYRDSQRRNDPGDAVDRLPVG